MRVNVSETKITLHLDRCMWVVQPTCTCRQKNTDYLCHAAASSVFNIVSGLKSGFPRNYL